MQPSQVCSMHFAQLLKLIFHFPRDTQIANLIAGVLTLFKALGHLVAIWYDFVVGLLISQDPHSLMVSIALTSRTDAC